MPLRPGDNLIEGSPAVADRGGEIPEPPAGAAPGAPYLDGLGEGQELVVVAGDPELREVVSLRIRVVAANVGGSNLGVPAALPLAASRFSRSSSIHRLYFSLISSGDGPPGSCESPAASGPAGAASSASSA